MQIWALSVSFCTPFLNICRMHPCSSRAGAHFWDHHHLIHFDSHHWAVLVCMNCVFFWMKKMDGYDVLQVLVGVKPKWGWNPPKQGAQMTKPVDFSERLDCWLQEELRRPSGLTSLLKSAASIGQPWACPAGFSKVPRTESHSPLDSQLQLLLISTWTSWASCCCLWCADTAKKAGLHMFVTALEAAVGCCPELGAAPLVWPLQCQGERNNFPKGKWESEAKLLSVAQNRVCPISSVHFRHKRNCTADLGSSLVWCAHSRIEILQWSNMTYASGPFFVFIKP